MVDKEFLKTARKKLAEADNKLDKAVDRTFERVKGL